MKILISRNATLSLIHQWAVPGLKLLLDENLSPALVSHLGSDDVDVVHVRDRGRQGIPDHLIAEWAYSEDRILVTANVRDFEKLARVRGSHPGLVLIEDGQMPRRDQMLLMERICAKLGPKSRDLVNCVLRVSVEGVMTWEEISS